MADQQHQTLTSSRATAGASLPPAVLFSLAVHAAAAGILFQNWQRSSFEPPRPLTVMLEAAPPVIVEAPPAPPAVHKHVTAQPKSRALPVPALHHAPAPSVIAVERVETAPPAVVTVAEVAAPPVVVAKAPATVSATARAESIEPPHFNVAYLNNPRPAYPPIARKLGLEGVVLLRVDVSAGGAPEKIAIAQTSGASLLDEAAMKAVQGWTFVPARRGEKPIAHPVEVPIRFQLKN